MVLRRQAPWAPLMIAVLLVGASAGVSWAIVAEGTADLEALAAATQADNSDAESWFAYAEALLAVERDDEAGEALEQVLARSPYHEGARLDKTLLLARTGQHDALLAWMGELVFTHPAMADNCFARSELAPYLDDPRFQALAQEARIQAVD